MQNIASTFKYQKTESYQVCLINNLIKGGQLASLLSQMTPDQVKEVQSIVYGGTNKFSKEDCQVIIEKYLNKKPPHALQELKIIKPDLRDAFLITNLLTAIDENVKLCSLSLQGITLESQSIDKLVSIFSQKVACM